MTGGPLPFALVATLALLLAVAAVTDLRSRTISNGLNGAIALLAPLFWWVSGTAVWPDLAIQLGWALAVFALFAAMFAAGWMGGGDVKLLGALALWLPFTQMVQLLMIMSIAGGALTLIVLAAHKWRKLPASPEIPYGVAIAIAGMWVIYERYLNQFA